MKSGNDSTSVLLVFIMQSDTCCMKQRMGLLTFKNTWTHSSFCRSNDWRYNCCSEVTAPHCLPSAVLQQSQTKSECQRLSHQALSCHSFNIHNLTEGSCSERSAGGFSQPFHSMCFSSSPGYSNKRHFEALQVTAARMTSQFCRAMDQSFKLEVCKGCSPLSHIYT